MNAITRRPNVFSVSALIAAAAIAGAGFTAFTASLLPLLRSRRLAVSEVLAVDCAETPCTSRGLAKR
jgi:hypothetical protein